MTLLIAGTLMAPAALAAAGGGGHRASPAVRKAALQERHRKVIRRLNLTPEQRQAIRDYRAGYRQRVAKLDAQLHVKRVDLENEMEKPEPDPAKVKLLTDEIGRLKAERDLERLKAKRELEKVLTPEQNEELKRIQQERGAGGDSGGEDVPADE
jgi:Spy/CpxP family protein refolding chaperone